VEMSEKDRAWLPLDEYEPELRRRMSLSDTVGALP
jgi:hypothetical protein